MVNKTLGNSDGGGVNEEPIWQNSSLAEIPPTSCIILLRGFFLSMTKGQPPGFQETYY